MKKLSIEEKAKRYDEAIEIAKEINNEQRAQPFNIMTRVFPELKKNEDEKIRKEIIAFLKEGKSYHCPNSVKRQEWAVWLEKQGETFTKKDVDDAYLKGVCDTKQEFEKQGEQKFAWSEEDERMYKKIETAIDSYYAPFSRDAEEMSEWFKNLKDRVGCEVNCTTTKDWSEEDELRMENILSVIEGHGYPMEVEWIKSLKDRVRPQPKQEWSEEDEKIYQSIMDDTVQENQLNDKQTHWLKDIKYRYFPQLKQEWDKEDCNQIEIIACHLDNIGNGAMAESLLNIMNKYKSCKPQNTWRPSDGQIEAITCAVRNMKESACYDSELVSLLNDLKKLKK